jgi:AraC-like DNA-binding protein
MRLLREEPDTPAVDIAARVGFSDRSNFSRQFLAYTGLTPAQWRKKAGISHDIPARKTIMLN